MADNRFVVFDVEKGEITDDFKLIRKDAIEARKNAIAKELERKQKAVKYADYGDFYFLAYDDAFFDQLKGADLLRVLYLASYIQYSSNGHHMSVNKKRFCKDDCAKLLRMGKSAFYEFWNRCISLKLIKEDAEGHVVLSDTYFYKGKLTKRRMEKYQKLMRIQISSVRELYETHNASEHAKLSYLYRLMPYVTEENNTVHVHNEIEYPTAADISEILGCDVRTWRRLKQWYSEISFTHNGKAQRLVLISLRNRNEYVFVINPALYYSGSSYKELLETIGLCP